MKLVAVIAVALAIVSRVHCQSLRTQIDQESKKVAGIMTVKDAAALKTYLRTVVSSSFQYVEGDTTMNLDQMCGRVAQILRQLKKVTRAHASVVSLREGDREATATIRHSTEGTGLGPDHRMHVMSFDGVSRNSYVRERGTWKLSRMAWVRQTFRMDGKLMPGQTMGKVK